MKFQDLQQRWAGVRVKVQKEDGEERSWRLKIGDGYDDSQHTAN